MPLVIGRYRILVIALGTPFPAAVIRNDWSNAVIMLGMVVIGVGDNVAFINNDRLRQVLPGTSATLARPSPVDPAA